MLVSWYHNVDCSHNRVVLVRAGTTGSGSGSDLHTATGTELPEPLTEEILSARHKLTDWYRPVPMSDGWRHWWHWSGAISSVTGSILINSQVLAERLTEDSSDAVCCVAGAGLWYLTPHHSSAVPGHSLGHRRGVTVATRKKASHQAAPHSTHWRLTIKVSTCPKCYVTNYCWTLVRGEWGQVWRLTGPHWPQHYQRKLSREWHDTCNDLPCHQILRSRHSGHWSPGNSTLNNTWDLTSDW